MGAVTGPRDAREDGWWDPSAPGNFEPQLTEPAPPPPPVPFEIPDNDHLDFDRPAGGPPAQPTGAARAAPTAPAGAATQVRAPTRAAPRAPGAPRASLDGQTDRSSSVLARTLRSRQRQARPRAQRPARRWLRPAIIAEIVAVAVLALIVVIFYSIFVTPKIPDQVRLTVDSYYFGVEDHIGLTPLGGYICPAQRTAWRQAQLGTTGDTGMGIVSYHIDSGERSGPGWRVKVTLKLVGDAKSKATLTLVGDGGGYQICGGTDQP